MKKRNMMSDDVRWWDFGENPSKEHKKLPRFIWSKNVQPCPNIRQFEKKAVALYFCENQDYYSFPSVKIGAHLYSLFINLRFKSRLKAAS